MYICNITGNTFQLQNSEKHREGGSNFGYNCRFRAICYILTTILYGECKILHYLKPNKAIKGIGMSDATWSSYLKKKFNYMNTSNKIEPLLNIYNPADVKNYAMLDFIISSDIFTHISPYPSLQLAFNNLYKMLKPGGHLIFSAPYNNNTKHIEHFPNLYKYKISKINDKYVMYNLKKTGETERFDNLTFHSDTGKLLQMRVFSNKSIYSYLERSGFTDIVFHAISEDMNRYGIFWESDASLIITAKKPQS